jgi:hypothetical protein
VAVVTLLAYCCDAVTLLLHSCYTVLYTVVYTIGKDNCCGGFEEICPTQFAQVIRLFFFFFFFFLVFEKRPADNTYITQV